MELPQKNETSPVSGDEARNPSWHVSKYWCHDSRVGSEDLYSGCHFTPHYVLIVFPCSLQHHQCEEAATQCPTARKYGTSMLQLFATFPFPTRRMVASRYVYPSDMQCDNSGEKTKWETATAFYPDNSSEGVRELTHWRIQLVRKASRVRKNLLPTQVVTKIKDIKKY